MNALMSPKIQLWISWAIFTIAWIAWPVTGATVFADEPPGILGLSWFAIIWTAWGNIVSSQINKEVSVQADTANVEADEVHINDRASDE